MLFKRYFYEHRMDLANFRRRAARNRAGLVAFLQKLDEIVPEDMPALVAEPAEAV